jgi:hypothetical protein
MTSTPPEVALNRVLAGLEKELVEATDEEIVQAAEDLGMNVRMKGSAAFLGVKYTFPKNMADVFEAGELRKFYEAAMRQHQGEGEQPSGRRRRPDLPRSGRKDRDEDDK